MLLATYLTFLALKQKAAFDEARWNANQSAEFEISQWQPGSMDRATPDPRIWVKKLDLAGYWDRSNGFDGSSLHFVPLGGGEFFVKVRTFGCVARWDLDRKARFVKGTILFDKPVAVYPSEKYDRLYPVKVYGHTYLTPPTSVAVVIARGQKAEDTVRFNQGTVGRATPSKLSR